MIVVGRDAQYQGWNHTYFCAEDTLWRIDIASEVEGEDVGDRTSKCSPISFWIDPGQNFTGATWTDFREPTNLYVAAGSLMVRTGCRHGLAKRGFRPQQSHLE